MPRRSLALAALLAAGLLLTAGVAQAHHSFAPFDMSRSVSLTGILTKVDWRNPHIELWIDVTDEQGRVEAWRMEGGPPERFKRRGLARDSVTSAIGQTVTVEAGVAKDGSRHGHMQRIRLPDGTMTPAQ